MKQQSLPDLSSYSSRLRHLHNIISLVQDKQFNLMIYSSDCETMGCALGWATQDPAFQAVGFRVRENTYGNWVPEYEHRDHFHAAKLFFGLPSLGDTEYLFAIKFYDDTLSFASNAGYGLFREEFLRRLDRYIKKAEVKENETATVP